MYILFPRNDARTAIAILPHLSLQMTPVKRKAEPRKGGHRCDDVGLALDERGLKATPVIWTCHLHEQINSFYLRKSNGIRFSIIHKPKKS